MEYLCDLRIGNIQSCECLDLKWVNIFDKPRTEETARKIAFRLDPHIFKAMLFIFLGGYNENNVFDPCLGFTETFSHHSSNFFFQFWWLWFFDYKKIIGRHILQNTKIVKVLRKFKDY